MNGYQFVISKQTEWAKNQGINLIGSQGDSGRPSYTPHLNDNLFQPLLPEVRKSFDDGDENELNGKMRAVHSSSALGVNIFQYWKSISKVPIIAAACGFCRKDSPEPRVIKFEEKCLISDNFSKHPNIDVVINCKPDSKIQCYAIECKFSEAYGYRKHSGLKEKYLKCTHLWDDIPSLRGLAERISPDDSDFKHLHSAQLIKHILGLKRKFGHSGFRLLYLWYDVLGEEGKRHRDETEQFALVARNDGIKFHTLTYQELISKLATELREGHNEYIQYLTERYL